MGSNPIIPIGDVASTLLGAFITEMRVLINIPVKLNTGNWMEPLAAD